MVTTTECSVLYLPESAEQRFLPEGPYSLADGNISWVAIQHGGEATTGAINILDPNTGTNQAFPLHGRPGFAFPTSQTGVFVCGVERSLGLYDCNQKSWTELCGNVDSAVENTVINDGMIFGDNVIFGCKDLEFASKKAGLYLWKQNSKQLIQLRDDQICSNGKAICENTDGTLALIDIDSPSQTITRCTIDLDTGKVGEPQVIVDLTAGEVFPDGMILTPDHKSLIVALYDPADPDFGVARQYGLASGELEAIWTCPGSPRVTCPQLVRVDGSVQLLLTTAVEHMEADQQARHPAAGALFIGATNFTEIGDQPVLSVD